MYEVIEVSVCEMEIVRCPKWDLYHGGACYGVKPKDEESFYYVGTEQECQAHLKWMEGLQCTVK